MRKGFLPVLAAVICLLSLPCGATLYVSKSGSDAASGLSWAAAKLTIGAALAVAPQGEQIWVAEGEYPERITLPKNVWVYGGFGGSETLLSQRSITGHPVIINGMASGTVVTIPSTAGSSRLDGFTITNGSDGGIRCTDSTPVIANNTITGNRTSVGAASGAGVSIISSATVQVTGNTISLNTASGSGGGLYCSGPVLVTNNTIVANSSSGSGGGVRASGASGTIANNTIASNSAGLTGGGIQIVNCGATLSVINNTISANGTGTEGGAVALNLSPIVLGNNIIAFNSSGVYRTTNPGAPTLSHNCVYNPVSYNYSGLSAGAGDISADPHLVSVSHGEMHIQPDSPCKDAGAGVFVQPGWTDIDGQPRVMAGTVDIGADESNGLPRTYASAVIRVSPTGLDANSGADWAHPKRTVAAAVAALPPGGGDIWAAEGSYIENLTLTLPYVHLYGGFAGTELQLSERVVSDSSPSILDGDALATTIIFTAPGFESVTLDGFRVQNGLSAFGGGVYCLMSSPLITLCNITANNTASGAGGIYAYYCSPVIQSSSISANVTGGDGGGIGMTYSTPLISGCRIVNNAASGNGGGIAASVTRPVISACEISGNLTNGAGAAIYCSSTGARITGNTIASNIAGPGASGGAVAGVLFRGEITGNTISGNRGQTGGALFLQSPQSARVERNSIVFNTANDGQGGGVYTAGGNLILAGNLITGNSATATGSAVYCQGGAATITNNTLAANTGAAALVLPDSGVAANNIVAFNSTGIQKGALSTASARNNCVYNPAGANYSGSASPGTGDIQQDPVFVNPALLDYHLAPASPCIDTGWPSAPEIPATDLDAQARPQGSAIDIGSDEFVAFVAGTIPSARAASNGTGVSLTGAIVTAVFPGCFYIESPDRSAGLRVAWSGGGLTSGVSASVTGATSTTADWEKQIVASSVSVEGPGAVFPLGMRAETLGGQDLAFSAVSGAGQRGVAGGFGLNNVGLLVKVAGQVSFAGADFFYLTDGSDISDGSGHAGVKVLLSSGAPPAEGAYVAVTAISSCVLDQGQLRPVLRVPDASGVQTLAP